MSDEEIWREFFELERRLNVDRRAAIAIYRTWYKEQLEKKSSPELIHRVMCLTRIVGTVGQALSTYKARRTVVLLVHGIRTQAEWQGMVRAVLAAPDIEVVPLKYGFLDVFRFWCPIGTRSRPIKELLWRIRDAYRIYPNSRFSVIAHSFGTYAIATILRENPDLEFSRLLLCGSVIEPDFRWDMLPNRPPIVNDCGSRDIWPILARAVTWGYGASGTFGFGTAGIRDRFHDICHSDYFSQPFVEQFWKPWVHQGALIDSQFGQQQPPAPWWRSVLGFLPIRWFLLLLIAAFAYLMIKWLW